MKLNNDRYLRKPMHTKEMNYKDIVAKQKPIEANIKYQLQVDRCRSVLKETTV